MTSRSRSKSLKEHVRDEVDCVGVLFDALPVLGELVKHLHGINGDVNLILLSPGLHSNQDNPGVELFLVNLGVYNRTGAGGKHWVKHAQSVNQSTEGRWGRGENMGPELANHTESASPFSFPRAKIKNHTTLYSLLSLKTISTPTSALSVAWRIMRM